MKLSRRQLRQLINEELGRLREEDKKHGIAVGMTVKGDPNQKPTDKVYPGGKSMNDIEAMSEKEREEYWVKVNSGEIEQIATAAGESIKMNERISRRQHKK
jgi:hypothetical protein